MKLIWIIHLALTVEGFRPLVCPDGRNIENYNGSVSISDRGIPCRDWSEIDPTYLSHLFREETQVPQNNYCRYISGEVKCIGYWSGGYQGVLNCFRSICGVENFADVYYGGFVTSASGWLAANNPDVKGCYWVLQAPIGVVIEVNVLYLYTNDYRDAGRCTGSYLSIYETKETTQNRFCGNVTPTVTSRSHELFIHYYSGIYAWRNERFHLTYLHILQGFFNQVSAEAVTDNATADGRTTSDKADTSTVNITSSSSQQASSENGISATTATTIRPTSNETNETEANGCSAVESTWLVLCPTNALVVLSLVKC